MNKEEILENITEFDIVAYYFKEKYTATVKPFDAVCYYMRKHESKEEEYHEVPVL